MKKKKKRILDVYCNECMRKFKTQETLRTTWDYFELIAHKDTCRDCVKKRLWDAIG